MRRTMLLLTVLAVSLAACGRLGVGEPGCESVVRSPSTANILMAQSVPSAKYAPCINAMSLAWDGLEFEARNGEAGFEIFRNFDVVLEVTLTESCDTSGSTQVASGYEDIERFEGIRAVEPAVGVTIVPTADRPLVRARALADTYDGTTIEDRPLAIEVDEDLDMAIRDRVNRALLEQDFLWIITELDVDANTVELRQPGDLGVRRSVPIEEALDLMEDQLPDVSYEGFWYFTFPGGCITYEFDAGGRVAETIAEDAETALGFYPLYDLRRLARRTGYDVGGVESD